MSSNKIVWVDLETSDLDPDKGFIMEIAAIVTDGNLVPMAQPFHEVIAYSDNYTTDDRVSRWAVDHHGDGNPSLWDRCKNTSATNEEVEQRFCAFLDHHRKNKRLVIAGSSVHFDLEYLRRCMPSVKTRLHYRTIDVSGILELAKRWFPKLIADLPPKSETHRALDDIRASINLLQFFRGHLFVPEYPMRTTRNMQNTQIPAEEVQTVYQPQYHHQHPQPQYQHPQPQYQHPQPQYQHPQPQYQHQQHPQPLNLYDMRSTTFKLSSYVVGGYM